MSSTDVMVTYAYETRVFHPNGTSEQFIVRGNTVLHLPTFAMSEMRRTARLEYRDEDGNYLWQESIRCHGGNCWRSLPADSASGPEMKLEYFRVSASRGACLQSMREAAIAGVSVASRASLGMRLNDLPTLADVLIEHPDSDCGPDTKEMSIEALERLSYACVTAPDGSYVMEECGFPMLELNLVSDEDGAPVCVEVDVAFGSASDIDHKTYFPLTSENEAFSAASAMAVEAGLSADDYIASCTADFSGSGRRVFSAELPIESFVLPSRPAWLDCRQH